VINVVKYININTGNDVMFEKAMEFLEEEAAELHNSGENERKAADDRQTTNNSNKGSGEGTGMYISCLEQESSLVLWFHVGCRLQ